MKKNISVGFVILLFLFSFSIRWPHALSQTVESDESVPSYTSVVLADYNRSITDLMTT